jgi:protein-L-isoaspartate(D-aspartate) O-methyltransferase
MEPKTYWDIENTRVLEVIRNIDRSLFVPPGLKASADRDQPLPIGYSQTISQPYIVAYMSAALQVNRDHKVLEIGTGSGYQSAVLSEIAGHVYTVETIPELFTRARKLLSSLGYQNITCILGDGKLGFPPEAPYDRIMVTAAAYEIPQKLVQQLAVGGIMVLPVGTPGGIQELISCRKLPSGELDEHHLLDVRFVPLV